MARTIAEIKDELTARFVEDENIRNLYGLDPAKKFDEQFSRISLESILFYTVAVCTWTLESLFDKHQKEVEDYINQMKPHSLLWYANKAKAFQCGHSLKKDDDRYDNSALTDEEVKAAQVIKYAAVVEKAAVVYVKVAGETGGKRGKLSQLQEDALTTYFKEVKDAGVKLEIVNSEADLFNVHMDVYYNPQMLDSNLNSLGNGGNKVVQRTIAGFVENLPFNGEYRNSALISELLKIDGVELVELHQATCNGEPINAKEVPGSGYFKADIDNMNIKTIAYETVSE